MGRFAAAAAEAYPRAAVGARLFFAASTACLPLAADQLQIAGARSGAKQLNLIWDTAGKCLMRWKFGLQ